MVIRTNSLFLAFLMMVVSYKAFSQGHVRSHRTTQSSRLEKVHAIKKARERNQVRIQQQGRERLIVANGIPDHSIGEFPNPGNPHEISAQSYQFRIPTSPTLTGSVTKLQMNYNFGIAVNGVPFDPGAAEWFEEKRGSKWQYEALSGAVALGVDENHAHVQPTGAYHYHGLPTGLMEKLNLRKGTPSPVIGWAADGFPIYAMYDEYGEEVKSSYRVKHGNRPSGQGNPGGRYDGTFVADYEYVQSLSDLDECNGKKLTNGEYAYFLTRSFPVIPRCFKGSPQASFRKQMREDRDQQNQNRGEGKQSAEGHRHQPPSEARIACKGKSFRANCSFQAPHGRVAGTCFMPPRSQELACRPEGRR